MSEKRKYQPITAEELKLMLKEAKSNYLLYCNRYAELFGQENNKVDEKEYAACIEPLKISTGIFDEAMRRVARDYSDEKYQMLDTYYRYVQISEAWGTRLWMNILYNLMGFPKTFWLMRHFKWLL